MLIYGITSSFTIVATTNGIKVTFDDEVIPTWVELFVSCIILALVSINTKVSSTDKEPTSKSRMLIGIDSLDQKRPLVVTNLR